MLEAVARENYKTSIPGRAGILGCAIAHAKKGVVTESRKIARVGYLGQKMNIGSARMRKL